MALVARGGFAVAGGLAEDPDVASWGAGEQRGFGPGLLDALR